MLLPTSNVVKNNDPIQLYGNMGLFTQLNYKRVHGFTIFGDITVTKVNNLVETDIPNIHDIKDITITALNQQLDKILTNYP